MLTDTFQVFSSLHNPSFPQKELGFLRPALFIKWIACSASPTSGRILCFHPRAVSATGKLRRNDVGVVQTGVWAAELALTTRLFLDLQQMVFSLLPLKAA